jgi:hypothetical protein
VARRGLCYPGSQKRDLEYPPAHRDKTAMNGAQLFKIQSDPSELMNGPPAVNCQGCDVSLENCDSRGRFAHGNVLLQEQRRIATNRFSIQLYSEMNRKLLSRHMPEADSCNIELNRRL